MNVGALYTHNQLLQQAADRTADPTHLAVWSLAKYNRQRCFTKITPPWIVCAGHLCRPLKTRAPREYKTMSVPVSVLILTLNEEANLPACLASLTWTDDIRVLDSFSTDNTIKIAEEAGAIVTRRRFDNWSSHQNWALSNIPFKYPWVLYIDADERVTPEMRSSIEEAVQNPGENVAFEVLRRDFFNGGWLRHVQTSPFYMRLFRPEHMHHERLVHPVSTADGPVGCLSGSLDHYPFSKGIMQWFEKHNSYSSFEAQQITDDRRKHRKYSVIGAFCAKDFHQRRYNQKELFYRLPCRPFIKFVLLYVLKRGFLDGKAGFTYAILQAIYEYMIVLKTRELTNPKTTRDFAASPHSAISK